MVRSVEEIARGALRRLSGTADKSSPALQGLHLTSLTLPQFRALTFLDMEVPPVTEVLEALRAGRPVTLDRPRIERELDLDSYPPRLREQFARWFSRISGYGVALMGENRDVNTAPRPCSCKPPLPEDPAPPRAASEDAAENSLAKPDRQVLETLLGAGPCEPGTCLIEPGKECSSGTRCKSLGF